MSFFIKARTREFHNANLSEARYIFTDEKEDLGEVDIFVINDSFSIEII